MTTRFSAIVLAAGRSLRMGEVDKLTLAVEGKPLLCHAIDALRESSVAEIVVVVGLDSDAIVEALGERAVRIVQNPNAGSGMGTSIAAGIEALSGSDGALVCLGDMPRVSPAIIDELIGAFREPDTIAVPVQGGRRGHPVLFGAAHYAALRALDGDRGGRALLDQSGSHLVEVSCDDPGIHRDIDTFEDLAGLRSTVETTAEIRDAYDAKAELYANFVLGELDRAPATDREFLASFAELARLRDGAVADLGCGPGYVVNHLAELGVAAFGYDISPALIAEARRAFPDSEFKVGDFSELDMASSSLAGIVSRYSIIHTLPVELGRIFREWFRVLAPEAPILVSFFAASSAQTHGAPFDHAITTAHALFPPTIAAELRQAGFVGFEVATRDPLEGERALDHGTILARRAKD